MLSASAGPQMSLLVVELDVRGQVLNHSEEFWVWEFFRFK